MRLSKYKLGDLLELSDARNSDIRYSMDDVKGISVQKQFIETKANMEGVALGSYLLVKPDDFAYVTVTSRNGEKITIAHNTTNKTFVVSSSYVVFRVSKKNIVDSDYLFMYFNRSEFDHYARVNSWGSARETFSWEDMCDIEMELPDLPTQQKYVAIYKAMQANQESYERGLEDLRLVCDGYIEDLRRRMPCEKIGPYIEPCNERNENNAITLFQGVNVDHVFTDPKRVAENAENGCIVRTGQFAFNKVMKAHNTKLPFALREGPDCVVSSSYQVFQIGNTHKLLPKYLLIWMNRSETQRYAGFVSFGTTRDIFSFDDMKEISIPIPDIKLQQCIVDIFSVYQMRREINERLKAQLSSMCPILIRGSLSHGG